MTKNSSFTLRSAIDETHNLSELQALCFDLGIDHEHIPGDEKLSKITGLVIYCHKNNRLKDMQIQLQQTHPEIEWEPLITNLPTTLPYDPTVPLQLLPPVEHFTDRETEINFLLQNLHPEQSVTLWGPGGIGKTAIAAAALHQLHKSGDLLTRFPDGIIFYTFNGRPAIEEAFDHIIRTYNPDATEISKQAAQRHLAGKKLLIILDSTEEADNLNDILEIRGQCGILITTRKRSGKSAARIAIYPLPSDNAVSLLNSWQDEHMDSDIALTIAELVGNLPLAINIAGRYLDESGEPAADYLAWLQATPIQALSHGNHRDDSIVILLEKSLAQVNPLACDVLSVTGLLAFHPFSRSPIAAALDLDPNSLRLAFADLVRYGLLTTQPQQQTYQVTHALIHTYANRQLAPSNEILTQLATYYINLTETESAKDLAGFRALHSERLHILTILNHCREHELWEPINSLVLAIGTQKGFLSMQGFWTDWINVLEVGLIAAQATNHQHNEASFLDSQGMAYFLLGQINKAMDFYQQALDLCQKTGNRKGEGIGFSNLGLAYRSLGEIEKSIECFSQSLEIARQVGDRYTEGIAIGNLGGAHRKLGQKETSAKYFTQALAIAREMDDKRYQGIWLNNLGGVYRELDQLKTAVGHCQQALDVAQEIGDRYSESTSLGNLGRIYRKQREVEKAIDTLEQALEIANENGDVRQKGNFLYFLGLSHRDLGQMEVARRYISQSITIFEGIKSSTAKYAQDMLDELSK